MGAACSRQSKVTQIKVVPKPQSNERDELFMNFGRPKNYDYKTALANVAITGDDTDVSSISTLEIVQTTENFKTIDKEKLVIQRTVDSAVSVDGREPQESSQAGKVIPDNIAKDTVTKDIGANVVKDKTPPNKNSIDITRKVGKILDTLIPSESPVQNRTRVGRQSRLMHADMNTVVSYDVIETTGPLGTKASKQKERKGKPMLITVEPSTSNISSPESPTQFHVCRHGIPLDDEEGMGCVKCQRPGSRGGRELQELLKLRRASRKTKRKHGQRVSRNASH